MMPCQCDETHDRRRRLVLTGGPGAGKTALLELIRQSFCSHVKVLPEAAGVVFGGGFPRDADAACQRAAQRAIFYVQRELETTGDSHNPAIVLCDRGTVDGLAYWPGPEDFWSSVSTTLDVELARYDAVIHLRLRPIGVTTTRILLPSAFAAVLMSESTVIRTIAAAGAENAVRHDKRHNIRHDGWTYHAYIVVYVDFITYY